MIQTLDVLISVLPVKLCKVGTKETNAHPSRDDPSKRQMERSITRLG